MSSLPTSVICIFRHFWLLKLSKDKPFSCLHSDQNWSSSSNKFFQVMFRKNKTLLVCTHDASNSGSDYLKLNIFALRCCWCWRQEWDKNTPSSCSHSWNLLLGVPFWRGFKFPLLTYVIDWGQSTTQLTGQWYGCIHDSVGLNHVWIWIHPLIIILGDLFATRLVKFMSAMANFICAATDQL